MKKDYMLYFNFMCLGIIIIILLFVRIFMFVALENKLNEEITNLRQKNIELKWQLEQVDQIICVNGGNNEK